MMSQNDLDLKLSSYDFDLPQDLIAQRPIPGRDGSRLLVYNESSDQIIHTTFNELPNILNPQTVLTFNQSKVFPCRLIVKRPTGGKVELFFLSLIPSVDMTYSVMIKSSRKKIIGERYLHECGVEFELSHVNDNGLFRVKLLSECNLESILNDFGKIPIPPYIRGGDSDAQDREDYQTVYASECGSVAAPTAGLHFTDELLDQLAQKDVTAAYTTLHVGLGTFLPVKTEDIKDHQMHSEEYKFSAKNLSLINNANKLIAVGTTSLRALESSCNQEGVFNVDADQFYSTNIFLHPGKQVNSIDGLITNFHLPKSTLLMLVSSLIGREKTLEIYREAISKKYRFFSYGDAMLILRSRYHE